MILWTVLDKTIKFKVIRSVNSEVTLIPTFESNLKFFERLKIVLQFSYGTPTITNKIKKNICNTHFNTRSMQLLQCIYKHFVLAKREREKVSGIETACVQISCV